VLKGGLRVKNQKDRALCVEKEELRAENKMGAH